MAKPKMTRWVCPQCETGKLAPTRPRRDDVRRYCLSCSAKTGRLVERVAPALERKRETGAERSRAKAEAKRQRERERAKRGRVITVLGPDGPEELDGPKTIERMMKLKAIKRQPFTYYPPEVEMRKSRSKPHTSGHAWTGDRLVVTAAKNATRGEVEAVLLHELAHVVAPTAEHHGPVWRRCYVDAAAEWFGREFDVLMGEDATWQLDRRVIAEADRLMLARAEEEAA